MYLVAFYLSWLVYLVVVVIDLDKYILGYYALWSFVHFIVPLQGFLNCRSVYCRPRLSRRWNKLIRAWKAQLNSKKPRRRFSGSWLLAFPNAAATLIILVGQ
jgi:hypothetical protein